MMLREWVPDYGEFLLSPEWQAVRKEVLAREYGTCEFCEARATEVHHVSYQYLTNPWMCIPVCKRCHAECDADRESDWLAHLLVAPSVQKWAERHLGRQPGIGYGGGLTAHAVGAAYVREQHRCTVEWLNENEHNIDDEQRRAYWRWWYRVRDDIE